MTQSHPRVAVIILTWNQRDLTLDCLRSLSASDYPQEFHQIIVVDNGSQDGTAAAIRAAYPSVVVLENAENLGFAAGNNVGLRFALQGDAQYLMLLNNDTVVDTDMLSRLVQVIEQDSTIVIVGPKMLYYDQPARIWCAGNRIDWQLGGSIRLQAEEEESAAEEPLRDVDFITACAILLRRSAVERVGLLDPRFFIYYEETDWCVRIARATGQRVVYVPTAKIWHKVSAAMGVSSPPTDYYMTRNVLLFLTKNLRGPQRLVAIARTAVRNLLTIAAYTVKSHGGRRIPHRNVRLLALRDAALGRWGKMGDDVAETCGRGQS